MGKKRVKSAFYAFKVGPLKVAPRRNRGGAAKKIGGAIFRYSFGLFSALRFTDQKFLLRKLREPKMGSEMRAPRFLG